MLVALGGMFSEHSGIINIALEGIMVIGGVAGVLTLTMLPASMPAFATVLIAVLVAAIAGMIYSLLLAFASINLKADQTIGGTALNLLATAVAVVISKNFSDSGSAKLNYSNKPFLFSIGGLELSIFVPLGIALLIISYIVLYKTRFGLRLRACGEHPQAADSVGINVYKMRYAGVVISGALGAIGGLAYIVPPVQTWNFEVTVFEALHELGGVLVYGIPEFRLPKQKVVAKEIAKVKELGVHFETNVVIGKSTTIDMLIEDEGFEAVFIGSGAGLPKFMGIPGENANGVFSANEYLTRSNLMKAFDDSYDTPIAAGKKVAVVGGGNVAMDAARTALRLGAEVHIVYRRSEEELPARVEEVHHAKEEGVQFDLLTNPVEILEEDGWVKGIKCVRMELGEPDASGRRRPVPVEGSEFVIDVDTVIMSLGTSPNPLISSTTKGLETNRRKCIVAEEENGQTSKEGVFAGGDAVTGAATVILAMGAGKAGAKGIDEYLRNK